MPSPNGENGNGHNATGVVRPRSEWITRRKTENTDGNFSQMHYARCGLVTEEISMLPIAKK